MATVSYTLEREWEENGEWQYVCYELEIDGSYTAGESASWGYYGGSPGCNTEAEIEGIEEWVECACPESLKDYLTRKQVVWVNGYKFWGGKCHKLVPWKGTLTQDEIESIQERLLEQAEEDRGDAMVDAYLDSLDRY